MAGNCDIEIQGALSVPVVTARNLRQFVCLLLPSSWGEQATRVRTWALGEDCVANYREDNLAHSKMTAEFTGLHALSFLPCVFIDTLSDAEVLQMTREQARKF
jgi:hypothetical protein